MTSSCHSVDGWMHLAQLLGPGEEKAGAVSGKRRDRLCGRRSCHFRCSRVSASASLGGIWLVSGSDLICDGISCPAYHPVFNALKTVGNISSVTVVTVSLVVP